MDATTERYSADRLYLTLSVEALRCNEIVEFDVYIQPRADAPPVLYRERHLVMTHEALARLRDAKVTRVFVPRSQRGPLRGYLEENLAVILSDPTVPLDEKSSLLYLSAQETVRDILENPFAGETLSRSRNIVGHAMNFLFEEVQAFASILRITSYDYYTYTHSVNVMVYSVALARHVALGDDAFCTRFGEATLLHDIGKSRVPSEITNAPGKLTKEQWEEMRKHPVFGKDILEELGVRDSMILDVALHHHEKLSGKGYPHGLWGDEIRDPVRVSTVADIFDALTTRRSYKEAMTTFEALRLMKEEMSHELDPKFFQAFVEMMGSTKAQH